MTLFEEITSKEIKRHEERLANYNANRAIIDMADEYGTMFINGGEMRSRSINVTDSTVTLNLHLFTNDSIGHDVKPIVEDMKGKENWHFTNRNENPDQEWVDWDFKKEQVEGETVQKVFNITAFYTSSRKCRQVGTGEFKEIMKVVCD